MFSGYNNLTEEERAYVVNVIMDSYSGWAWMTSQERDSHIKELCEMRDDFLLGDNPKEFSHVVDFEDFFEDSE